MSEAMTPTPPHVLTFRAEEAGDGPNAASDGTLVWLAWLLRAHPSPVVREGAVLDLAKWLHVPTIREILTRHTDPSPGVRAVCATVLSSTP
jgi:hypothetical protein